MLYMLHPEQVKNKEDEDWLYKAQASWSTHDQVTLSMCSRESYSKGGLPVHNTHTPLHPRCLLAS